MGTTGHTEVVLMNFDPAVIVFDDCQFVVSPRSKFRKLFAAKPEVS